nr:hypothetical protein [Tanacetum cinerariifolium]
MVYDNVGNQVRHNVVQNDGNEVGQNAVQNPVKPRKRDAAYLQQQLQIAQEKEAGIQSTQEEFEFRATADSYEETKRVKVNYTLEDTLQQASISGTQSDNAPIYDSDGSTEVSEQKGTTQGTRMNSMFTKQSILGKPPSSSYKEKLSSVTPFPKCLVLPKVNKTNALSIPVTSNSAPAIRESKVVQTINVIAHKIFRTNPFKTSKVDNVVPNKPVKTNVRIKPITVSQLNVIHKQQANSGSNGFSFTRVNNTAKTRRPHPRSNSNTNRVPSKSESSCLSNNVEKIEENHRNLKSSLNQKHMSSECNNITLAIRNAKFEIVCVMCKKCLVTANHDVCVLNYVNDMNSRADNQSTNVSICENQKKHKANAKKLKELGSKGSLALSRPNKPRTCLRWIQPKRIFAMCGKLTASSNTENKSKKSLCNNASTSNPSKPLSKGFSNFASLLGRNTLSDRVEVQGMIEKRSKVRMRIMPTEIELALEQSQHGVSYEVSKRLNLERHMLDGKLVLVDDDEKSLNKVDSLINADSGSEEDEVFNETTSFMTSMSSKTYGEDPYNDEDFDDCGLKDASLKFANAFDINLRGQLQ